VALVAALMLRQIDLVRIAVLLLALPLVVIIGMSLVSLHVTVRRDATPRRAYAGEPATVTVSLTNRGRRRTPTLLVEDGMPDGLDVATRVVAPPLPARATARLSYRVVPPRRGRYVLGPARVHAVEPFGLLERTWRAAGTDELLVRPRPEPLESMIRPIRAGGDADVARGGATAAGAMDLTVREYREGDDLRRVHWPSTARRGSLMVRRDERPEELRLAILLDTRRRAQSVGGASFEWAVVAAASVARRAADDGRVVSLLSDGVVDEADEEALQDHLAVVETGSDASLGEAVAALETSAASAVVAILGEVGPAEVAALADVARAARRVALLLDVAAFSGTRGAGTRRPHREALAGLAGGGWIARGVGPDDRIGPVWAELVGSRSR
jgi:uncharacterized protein (DUF58 family)